MSLTRRSFLTKTAGGILVAPALIREGFAMPVKTIHHPNNHRGVIELYKGDSFENSNDGNFIMFKQANGDWKIWQGP